MKMFMPSPDLAYNCELFAFWENGFTDIELDAICEMGERLPPQEALVGVNGGEKNIKTRDSIVSWIDPAGWLGDRLEYIVRQLNGQYFGLDLWGFGEKIQYTTYKYSKHNKGHYDWHMDQGPNNNAPRKLSLVLQLSDPDEYEDCELEIMTQANPIVAKKERGIVYAFPSYVMHRVTPITKGTRRSLVSWISGPKFK